MKRVEVARVSRGRRTVSPWGRAVAAFVVTTAILTGLVAQAQAATFTVGTTSDATETCADPAAGTCSLRQLISSVPAGSTISVPAGSYMLSHGPLVITQNLTIAGAGARTTTVEQNPPAGSPTARVFEIRPDATSGVKPTVTISGLEILFGKADSTNGSSGGNVLNQGTLTLKEDDIVLGQTTGGSGAGIANQNGTLTVTHSLIENNLSFATDGSGGTAAAIDNVASGLTTASVTVDNSTITGNTAQGGGGALVSRCVRCTSSSIAVTNSTIAFNDGGTTTTTNAGGLIAASGSTISVLNSIVASNTVSNRATLSNCAGTITSQGHNIETGADCGFKGTGDLQNTDPGFLFSGATDMGGNTDTIPLSASSPAVDAIPSNASNCTKTTDQRDINRPQGSNCDSGAYELIEPVEGAQFSEVVGRIDNTSATIDWGDGTAQSQGSVNTKKDNQVTGTHTYADAGTYHGTLHWLNSDGKPSLSPFDVIVTDAPLSAAADSITAVAGSQFNGRVGTFTDGNPLSTPSDFIASIDWGDGTKSAGTVATNASGGYLVNGTHTYANTGSFNTTVVVKDSGGSTDSAKGTASVNPPPPTVSAVSPSAGPTAGGTSVTITGTNFTGATDVKFGANAATSFTVNSATKITATAPAGSAGAVDIRVTTTGGTSATSAADRYTYTNTPAVTSVSPSAGPTGGGTSVTINGANLTGATAVKFGPTAATTFTVSATKITATAPARPAGTVDVTVTTPGGTSPTSTADQFTYAAAPSVTSVTPGFGPSLGGALVTIAGTNLGGSGTSLGNASVKFGNTPALIVSNTPTQIVVTAPAGSGTVPVTVTTPGGSDSTHQFTFVPPPTVTAINPSSGPSAGGTSVTITGTDFTGASAVHFGATPAASFHVDGPTQVTAISPAGTGSADVTVTTPNGTSATSPADLFTYTSPIIKPPPTGSPMVATGAPTVKSSSGAALEGSVNPQGLPTAAHYEYGLDAKFRAAGPIYDQSTPSQNVGSDFTSHTVTATLTGLVPNALYHVRLVATNGAGTSVGPDATFTTKADPPPPPPKLGGSFNAQPVNGVVLIEINGKFVPLTEVKQIPNGAIINALHGTLTLITATAGNGTTAQAARTKKKSPKSQSSTQKGTFGGAVFKVTQAHSGLATLSLVEGAAFPGAPTYASCKTQSGKAVAAALSKRALQLLHSRDNHGKFRTKGRYAAATTRGTVWTIADRCDGTLIHVSAGAMTVTDFVRHKTVTLRAGHSYLAPATAPKHK